MIDKIQPRIEQALAAITDGATIMVGGFGDTGIPTELLESGKITLLATSPDQSVKTITNSEELAEYLTYNQSSTPSQSTEFDINDPAFPGEKTTIKVFDTNELNGFLTEAQIGDAVLNTFDSQKSEIYKHFGIALATNGSIANLNIGDDTLNVRDKANTIELLAKDSSLLEAQGTASQVNWQSDNYIKFNAAPVIPEKTFTGSAQTSVFGDEFSLMTYKDYHAEASRLQEEWRAKYPRKR